jgi:hypothetical protein
VANNIPETVTVLAIMAVGVRRMARGQLAPSSRQPPTFLSLATENLVQQDYFQPYNYQALNAAGRDFGSAGVTLLDSDVFRGRHVRNIAISGGKSGRIYVMNGDDLGGFANGVSTGSSR